MPCSAGSSPAIARSRVDLPDPFRPITPTASPLYATNDMPRIACTSRIDGRRCRLTMRSSAVAAVPRSEPDPYTRYTTCRSSTTTIGSDTAVPCLGPPEEEEPGDDRHHGPPDRVPPELGHADHWMAVGAVVDDLVCEHLRGDMELSGAAVHRAPQRVVGVIAGHADPLVLQQRVPDQRDVDGRGVDLQQGGERRMVVQDLARGQRQRGLNAEYDTGGVHPGPDDERKQLTDVVEPGAPAGQDERAPDVEQCLQ